jgi:cytochrome c oxidase subunit III
MSVARAPARAARRVRDLPAGWWGMVVLIATETTVFGSLIATYFFLRMGAAAWPMDALASPAVLKPTLLTAALVATSVPMALAARAALGGRGGRTTALLLVVFAVQCAYLALQVAAYVGDLRDFGPDTDAYASCYYALLGVHHAHVVAGVALVAWLLARLLTGGLDRYRTNGVRVAALYVHFVNVMAVAVLLTELSPRL